VASLRLGNRCRSPSSLLFFHHVSFFSFFQGTFSFFEKEASHGEAWVSYPDFPLFNLEVGPFSNLFCPFPFLGQAALSRKRRVPQGFPPPCHAFSTFTVIQSLKVLLPFPSGEPDFLLSLPGPSMSRRDETRFSPRGLFPFAFLRVLPFGAKPILPSPDTYLRFPSYLCS